MPEYLETTAGKFTFRVAADRLYTKQGVWVKPDPGAKRVQAGMADYPQQHNGDVAFAKISPIGTTLAVGESFAEIETIKAMMELFAPISGRIVEANPALEAAPELINQSPYEEGWLAVFEPRAWESDRTKLLEPAAYFAVMKAQVEEDLKAI